MGRVVFEWHNKKIEAFGYTFKSKCEYRWACYLERLKSLGAIRAWCYEPKTFEFGERWRKRRIYTPDFYVTEGKFNEGVYHEVKTSLRQVDVTRFRCMAADYPDEKLVLVIFGAENTRKTEQNRRRANARKYVERIIFAEPLLNKMGIK